MNLSRHLVLRRDQIRVLITKDFKLKYNATALGFVWSLLMPVLTSVVYYFVFGIVMRFDAPNYLLYLISGTFLWIFSWNPAAMILTIWGDGSVRRDFLYVGDAVWAIDRALATPEAVGEINVGSGVAVSLNELIGEIERSLDTTVLRKYRPSRPFDVPQNKLDIAKARRILGWEPTVGLAEGIARTIKWIRSETEMEGDEL